MRYSRSIAHLAISGAVTVHVLAVCLYVLPVAWVAERVRILSIAYVRPLFHQQWKLFAPDPPMCSCGIEWSDDNTEWRSIESAHYLEERMVQNFARHAQAAIGADLGVDPLLIDAMRRSVAKEDERDVSFRLKEECVIDAEAPANRGTKITLIGK